MIAGAMRGMRSRSWRWVRAVAAATVVVLVAGACGDSTGTAGPSGQPEAVAGEWVRHPLGSIGGDHRFAAAPFGDSVAVLTVDQPGNLRAHLVADDGSVEEAVVAVEPARGRIVWALADGPNGLVALANELEPEIRALVLSSPDGTTWSATSTTGLEASMSLTDIVATDEGYVAVGYLRMKERAGGPFTPVVMTSPDGLDWSAPDLPHSDGSGTINAVVAVGDRLLATGEVDGAAVTWVSDDGGSTWTTDADVPAANEVAASGTTVLAVVTHDYLEVDELHRSDDGGRTWQEVGTEMADGLDLMVLSGDASGFVALMTVQHIDVFSSPERCYVDTDACGPIGLPEDFVALVSTDGLEWAQVDLRSLEGGAAPRSLLRTGAGGVVAVGGSADGQWSAWTWDPAQGDPPTTVRRIEEAAYDGPPFVEYGGSLEEGGRYAYPLYIHCGMSRLGELNARQWELVEGSARYRPETGAGDPIPEGWPVVDQTILGFVTLVAPDRIEYSLDDGEVIAAYRPMPIGTPVYGCQ
jgi:hypothetical protein